MNRADIQRVVDQHPTLCDHGIGLGDAARKLTHDERVLEFAAQREQLLNSEEACTRCCSWLAQIERRKTRLKGRSSYGLRHVMEDDTGTYVTNGAFIVAALHSGFEMYYHPHSPNVSFNMSKRSIKAIERRAFERRDVAQ